MSKQLLSYRLKFLFLSWARSSLHKNRLMLSQVSKFVQEGLSRKTAGYNVSQAILWGWINTVVLALLLYDIYIEGFSYSNTVIWWCTVAVCLVCVLNILTHIASFLSIAITLTPLEVNDQQRKLLSVTESDIGFKSPSASTNAHSAFVSEPSPKLSELYEATIRTPPPQTLYSSNLSSPNKSWNVSQTFPTAMYGSNTSFSPGTPSITSDSWSFHRSPLSLNSSFNISQISKQSLFNGSGSFLGRQSSLSPSNGRFLLNSSPMAISSPFTDRSFISTKDELDEYLKDFNEQEKRNHILSQNENGNGGSNSLWAYSSTNTHEALNILRKNVYQPATMDAGQEKSSLSDMTEDYKITSLSSSAVSKIWLKRNVTPKQLFQYEENLRIWLSMNVLEPLIGLIDSSNEAIATTAPELQIGNIGVDKLKKAAQNISGVKQLNTLLPFLDLTLHQDYLVQRLRELSNGGAISAYKWNSGGSFNGKPWREEYPTDTYILFHLFAMYMDNHLPPDPTQTDGRIFSNVYVVKTPEKPQKPAVNPCLCLTQMNPPHLKVILPGEEECDVGAGHKNFLHSLLLFCHYLIHQQHSHIAGVNLNLSGINLAWVLNAE